MLLFYINYIVPLSVLIPLVTALINFKYLSKPFKIIFWFVLLSGVINLICIILLEVLHKQNIIIYHIDNIFEFVVLSAFYYCFQNNTGRKAISWILVIFIILYIVELYFKGLSVNNTYTHSLSAVIIIAYCIQLTFKQSEKDDKINWGDDGINWINTGILIYFSSGLFMFMSANYFLTASQFMIRLIWTIHDTILFLQYVLFAIGFYKCKTHPTISTY
ncbi:MAG: hypothetical protein JWR05_2803 [Mucilaginibacter sp.]|nr:hypothetical protein [Mucilaginibacter sp.]